MIFINKIIQDPTEIRTRISRFKVLGANRYTMESLFYFRTRLDLNQRPFDLQSNALPLSYASKHFRKKFRSKILNLKLKT